jgi:hypothetical protein
MATVRGTKAFVQKFPKHNANTLAGFSVSPFGFGSYRVDHSNDAFKQAMLAAIRGGCNVSCLQSDPQNSHYVVILEGDRYIVKLYVWP